MFLRVILVGLFVFCANGQEKVEYGVVEQKILDSILKDYDPRIRPVGVNTTAQLGTLQLKPGPLLPVVVKVNIYVRSITVFNELESSWTLQLTYRNQWTDPRLAYGSNRIEGVTENPPFVVVSADRKIWLPDTFFQTKLESRRMKFDHDNTLIRVYKDGAILYSTRLLLKLSCPLSFGAYPFDTHSCDFDLASYSYTTDDIDYKWKEFRPVQLKQGLVGHSQQFSFDGNVEASDCSSSTNTGTYACLRATFRFTRCNGWFLLHTYFLPACLVALSFLQLWMPPHFAAARLALTIAVFIAVELMVLPVQMRSPTALSGASLLDVWLGGCFVLILLNVVQITVLRFIATQGQLFQQDVNTDAKSPRTTETLLTFDFLCRIIFPILLLLFVLFNAILVVVA